MDYDQQARLAKLPLSRGEQERIEQIRKDYAIAERRVKEEYDRKLAELRQFFVAQTDDFLTDLEAKYAANTPSGLA